MTSLQALGITSEQEAAELESDLGVRFNDFTPEDCETWVLQTVYLDQFSRTRAASLAADNAGVSIRTARQWHVENTLGFNNRLEIAVLRYTDVLEVMLFRRAQEPGSPPSLLMMLLRAHMPEKYGSARRSGAPRDDNPTDHHCDHDPQSNSTSQYDRELLEAIFQDLQNLKQFTGLPESFPLSPRERVKTYAPIPPPKNGHPQVQTPNLPMTLPHTPRRVLLPPLLPWERACPVLNTGAGVSAQNLAPRPQNLPSTAASAANSNAAPNGKNLTSPAPPTRQSPLTGTEIAPTIPS